MRAWGVTTAVELVAWIVRNGRNMASETLLPRFFERVQMWVLTIVGETRRVVLCRDLRQFLQCRMFENCRMSAIKLFIVWFFGLVRCAVGVAKSADFAQFSKAGMFCGISWEPTEAALFAHLCCDFVNR